MTAMTTLTAEATEAIAVTATNPRLRLRRRHLQVKVMSAKVS